MIWYLQSNISRFRILIVLGVFLLFSNIILAQDFGCCVGRVGEDYCVVSETSDCSIIKKGGSSIGGFFEGWAYFEEFNDNLRCLDSSDYNNLCGDVCCKIGNAYKNMKLIKCREFDGEVNGNIGTSCPVYLTNDGYCLNKEKGVCELKFEYECSKDNFYGSKPKCEAALGDGCVVYTKNEVVERCKAGNYEDSREGGSFVGKACKFVGGCNCGNEVFKCRSDEKGDAFEWTINNCGDKSNEIACGADEYCDIEKKECIIDPCEKKHLTDKNEESWCELIDPSGLKARHVVKSCFNGKEKIEPCDEFRNEVCKKDLLKGVYKAECVANQWGDCIGKGQDKCDNYFCEFVDNKECLPKYPPGFEFWKVKTVEDAHALTGNDKFCSVNTVEGCKRSGDCEGGSGVAEPEKPTVEGEGDIVKDYSGATIMLDTWDIRRYSMDYRPRLSLNFDDKYGRKSVISITISGKVKGVFWETWYMTKENPINIDDYIENPSKWIYWGSVGLNQKERTDWGSEYETKIGGNTYLFMVANLDNDDTDWEVGVIKK